MENKDLTAGKREAIYILKNENKTYAKIKKLLKKIYSRIERHTRGNLPVMT
jgi:hypothetical protein